VLQALLRPRGVDVRDVLPEHAAQVRLAQDEHMVQAFAAHSPQEPLADGILLGRAIRRAQLHDAGRRSDAGEGRPILAVVVADQVPRSLPEAGRLAQLLGDPGVRRLARDADMDDPVRAERDDEAGVERPETEVGDREEVAGLDVVGVIAQEGAPALAGAGWGSHAPQVLLHGRLGDAAVELEELAADALGAPEPIGRRHLGVDLGKRAPAAQ
jgi:hypothetical protein